MVFPQLFHKMCIVLRNNLYPNIFNERSVFLKFIFPQNYNFSNKLLGFIDYSTAIFLLCWCVLVGGLLHFFISDLTVKIVCFIVFCFPLFLFSIIGFNNENILYVLSYLIKFSLKKKCFLFSKDCNFN